MASTILSDNGVSSGSAGIKTTADSTGALALQTTTAGGAATTAMTIDTSQNVGIGTTSPRTSKLDVMSATGTQNTSGDNSGLVNITGPNGANGSQPLLVLATNDAMAANIGPALTFQARYITSSTAAATLGYIQCIKENATSNNLQGALTFVPRNSAGNFSEAMRIDSSGSVLINTTANPGGSAKLGIKGAGSTNATVGLYVINSSSAESLLLYDDQSVKMGTTGSAPYNNTTATAANAVFSSDGFLRRSTSSLKYKTDIQDATHGLTDLLKLRSVTYKGKRDGNIIFGGLIAEEVDAAGLTEFVQYAEDGSPDALAYGNMVSLCIKAIQEQQALITALTVRITALETK
jgi:hypothetical protein